MTGKTQMSWKHHPAWAEPVGIRVKYQIFLQLECCRVTRDGLWPLWMLVVHAAWPCSVHALQQLMQRYPRGLLSIPKMLRWVSRGDAAWTQAKGRAVMGPVEMSHVRPRCGRETH